MADTAPPAATGAERLRLFVAIPIAAEALAACRELIDGVRDGPAGKGARWVRPEGLHLTLKFLGSTDPARVAAVESAVGRVAAGGSRFLVGLRGAGAFPSPARPRVLWLGIDDGARALATLSGALDASLEPLGWPPAERAFRAHLTVARTDAADAVNAPAAARALVDAAAGWRCEFEADRLTLFRSHLGRGPAHYEAIAGATLGGHARPGDSSRG